MPIGAVCVYCSRKIDEKEKTVNAVYGSRKIDEREKTVNAPAAAGEIAHLACAQKTTILTTPRR